jgi:hypothetical protein
MILMDEIDLERLPPAASEVSGHREPHFVLAVSYHTGIRPLTFCSSNRRESKAAGGPRLTASVDWGREDR